jgi:RHS repeat-associated protein
MFRSIFKYVFILAGILVLHSSVRAQTNVVPDEIEFAVLKNIYDSLGGSGWTNKTNWPASGSWPASATSAQFGTWQGVTVANGDITRLTLSSNNLSGQLPKTIGNLKKLTYAYLQSNSITGSIPASFGGLTSIQYLYLHQNQLSGSIPTELGNLTALSRLLLNNNNLNGSIPSSLGNVTSLSQLYLNYNQLTGSVPSTLGNLTNLVYLYLRNNQLTGSLPSTLGGLTNLQHLSISNNQLNGTLPSGLSGLSELLFVDISNNQFTGSLPDITSWSKVNQLLIGRNQLSGAFPASISSLPLLTILQAEFNSFTSLPSSLLGLPVITTIGFSENELITVPDFATHVNKANLTLQLQKNRLDFSQLEILIGKGIKTFTYNPQKQFNDVTYVRAEPGGILLLPARNPGQNGSLVWERKLEGSSSWITITAQNEDATQRTFNKSNITTADDGLFRYRMTNTLFSGFAIESAPITVRVGLEVVWNGLTGVQESSGILSKTASTGWGNGKGNSENSLAASTDGWFEFVVDDNSLTSNYILGFSATDTDLTRAGIAYGMEINSLDGQKVYIHESSDTGTELGTWATGDVFKVHREGGTVRYYKNGTEIRSVAVSATGTYQIKSVLYSGKAPLVTASFWIPASRGIVPDAWEYEALKDLYDSTAGSGWSKKTSWPTTGNWNKNITAAQMDVWQGITVTSGDISSVVLSSGNLTGKIPSSISKLKGLKALDLQLNKLSGSIPTSLTQLTGLTDLRLYSNQLTGSIPADIGNLVNLTFLSFARNNLSGSVPASIGNLTQLYTIRLYGNVNLTGALPESFYNLVNLTEIYIYETGISGSLSESIGNLTKLKTFWGYNNKWSGTLPFSLGNITVLENLYLFGNNDLSGELPSSWSGLTNLKNFWIHYTHISGQIPAWVWTFTKMEILSVGDNDLEGTIPSEISNLTNLTELYMQRLKLSGGIPSSMQALNKLTLVDLKGSNLSGDIPEWLMKKSTIKTYGLADNDFTSLADFSSRTDKSTLKIYIENNQIPAGHIERYFTAANVHSFSAFTYGPQQNTKLVSAVNAPLHNILKIEAPSGGTHGLYLWEKKVDGAWTNVGAENESTTANIFEVNNVTADDAGIYRYTVTNSWLAGILFESGDIQVTITDALSPATTTRLYNGSITSVRWRTDKANGVEGQDLTGMYRYTYDEKYQVTDASFATVNHTTNTFSTEGNKYRLTGMEYDPNGNIQALKRYDEAAARIHNFSYGYQENSNKLQSVSGYADAYAYDAIGRMIDEDKYEGDGQHIEYDVTGKVRSVYVVTAQGNEKKAEYLYDDRGFRLAKVLYPRSGLTEEVRTTWYIRDAGGSVVSIYEQEGLPSESNNNPLIEVEVPIYGSGKIGAYYPAQDGSINYEVTDHLGNVRALVRENVVTYTATMENNGATDLSNPRELEKQLFLNIESSEDDRAAMNHTLPIPGVVDVPDKSSLLHWIDGMQGQGPAEKSMGPAIALRVKAGDTLRAEVWTRYEIKESYTPLSLATFASIMAGGYTGSVGLEGIAVGQTNQTFFNALAGIFTDADDDRPYAHLNFLLLNNSLQQVDANSWQVPEEGGYNAAELETGASATLEFADPVVVEEDGYIYIWVSNASENTKVWFDDLKITHSSAVFVTQTTDYGLWGEVLREQKTDESIYRHGYQGQFSERDLETGWNHFELREYDAVIGRWTTIDPYAQYWSPYVSTGNDPANKIDPNGAYSRGIAWLLSGFGLRGNIYKSGMSEDGSREVWGFNTSDGEAHFGEDARSFWTGDDIFARVNAQAIPGEPIPEYITRTRGGDAIEFDAATQLSAGFLAVSAGSAVVNTAARLGGAALMAREGVAITVENVGQDIALGLGDDLFKFAGEKGFMTYRDFSKGFQQDVIQAAIEKSSNNLHFNLTGFSKTRYARFDPNAIVNYRNITNWELHTIYNTPGALQRTTFYKFIDGVYKVQPAPF